MLDLFSQQMVSTVTETFFSLYADQFQTVVIVAAVSSQNTAMTSLQHAVWCGAMTCMKVTLLAPSNNSQTKFRRTKK